MAIPTTAGTGSEVTLWSVFTDDERRLKVAIGGVPMYPAVALCDPDLTEQLPPALTASTGMDALAHAIECYTNKACQPISAALALEGDLLDRPASSPCGGGTATDREARYAMLLASTMAGMAMNPTRLGLAHALAMPLGSWDLKIPHSVAIAVTLPLVMQFNASAAPERFVDVARALGERSDGCARSTRRAVRRRAVRGLADAIGIPKGRRRFGLREDHVGRVVDEAMKSGNVVVNPRETSRSSSPGFSGGPCSATPTSLRPSGTELHSRRDGCPSSSGASYRDSKPRAARRESRRVRRFDGSGRSGRR